MASLMQDVRFAVRSLRKGLLVTLLAGTSLCLAIAGNTAVFSLVNALIFRPLPFPEPERIVLIGEREESAPVTLTASESNFVDLAERNRAFEQLGGFRPGQRSLQGSEGGDRPISITAAAVSPQLFSVLGASPLRGRLLRAEEAAPGGARVALLHESFWRRQLAGLTDPVGEQVVLNGESHLIVGVLPQGFEFLQPNIDVFVPLVIDPADASRDQRTMLVVGRLRPGVSMSQAKQEMDRVWRELVAEHPADNRGYILDVLNLRTEIPTSQGRTLFALLQGTVVAVLLIACLNIANLMAARGEERRREIALRCVLGARQSRILRQVLTESVVLAAVGGAAGIGLGYVGIRVLATRFAPFLPSYWTPTLDGPVVVFSTLLTAFAGIVFGLAPAAQSLSLDLAGIVREGGRGIGGTGRRRRLSRALVVVEVALSLVLLTGASLLVRSFLELRHSDPGFNDANLVAVPVTLPGGADALDRRSLLIDELLERSRSIPGVVDATAATSLPLNALTLTATFEVDGRSRAEDEPPPRAAWVGVPAGYAETLEIPLISGRFFTAADREDAPPVAVVSASLARIHWPDESPLGERITFRDTSREIVGVVADTRQSVISQGDSALAVFYTPIAQQPPGSAFLLVRAGTTPESLIPALRTELDAVDPKLLVGQIQTLEGLVSQLFTGINVFNFVLTTFGGLALLLAAVGTYGVLAYNVARRSHEIGVRMALGARQSQVVRMISRQGVTLGIIGVVVGLPGVVAVGAVVQSVLTFAPPARPLTAVGIGAVLLGSTLLASVLPALRAARMQPTEVLCSE